MLGQAQGILGEEVMVTHNCPSLRTTAKEVVSLVIRALRDENTG